MREPNFITNYTNKLLIGCTFENMDFQNCDFSDSDLSFTTFKNCNLYNCNFNNTILYCTVFDTVNLTRANFNECYIYGVKFLSFSNITYATFENLKVEDYRRIGLRYNPQRSENYQLLSLSDSPSLFIKKEGLVYIINGFQFTFIKRSIHDKEREYSQIYNRLKRVHKENFFLNEAAKYYYLERKWYRKSYCKQDLSGKIETSKIKRFGKTLWSELCELSCGYGEKPFNTLFVAIILWLVFSIVFYFNTFKDHSEKLFYSIRLSALSLFSNQDIDGYDIVTQSVSLFETFLGIITFALFTATIIRKIIRD